MKRRMPWAVSCFEAMAKTYLQLGKHSRRSAWSTRQRWVSRIGYYEPNTVSCSIFTRLFTCVNGLTLAVIRCEGCQTTLVMSLMSDEQRTSESLIADGGCV